MPIPIVVGSSWAVTNNLYTCIVLVISANSTKPASKMNSLPQSGKLVIRHATHEDAGLYECIAHNGVDGDLRKYVDVKVRGK